MAGGLNRDRLARMHDVMAAHADGGRVPGLVWAVARRGEVHVGVAGSLYTDGSDEVERDTIFRIASMTKPVTAVAALILVEECVLRLDEPVDELLPELAGRRVLATHHGPLDDTLPADRPITLHDLLTFRLGLGWDFSTTGPQPVMAALAEARLGAGPPAPGRSPEPDEWMKRLGAVPLAFQPGERWLYDTGSDVLGVLVARASGQPLEELMGERIFEPLGMVDTGFSVASAELGRFGPAYWAPEGAIDVYDEADGQWAKPPAFPSGAGGLVSTIDDFLAFADMLRTGGTVRGGRILSRPSVEAMTTDHLTGAQKAAGGPDPTGALGWGFGVGVQGRRHGPARSVGSYGWDGGLGSSWANDPAEDLVGVVLTNMMWESSVPPRVCRDFWTCAYASIDD